MKMELLSEYVSCGCNRTPNAVDWGANDVIIYASCRSIAVYDPRFCNDAGIVKQTLSHHSGRVNSVRWLSNSKDKRTVSSFVSSSSDNTCILWTKKNSVYEPVAAPMQHDSIVNVSDGIEVVDDDGKICSFIASATAGSKVYIWKKESISDVIELVQVIDYNRGFMLDLKFTCLPVSNALILACAGEDSAITLYTWSESDHEFCKSLKLVGHEDWVRGLDITLDDTGDLLLASCSQDNLVRVWRISKNEHSTQNSDYKIKLNTNNFTVNTNERCYTYYVALETVLTGHENWIYGVQWHPPICSEGRNQHQPMKLLTSSMDKTMIVWCLDEESGIWIDRVRVGEVGGNTLGFYGSKFSPDGQSIVAHGFQGAFHMWHQSEADIWNPGVTVGGHFAEVQDLVWDVNGNFLISTSSDQTTRLHAPWIQKNLNEVTWHEIARPQIHGYDMTCLSITKDYLLISGADEKVLRAFQAPRNFIENLQVISEIEVNQDVSNLPEGANVPSLGLSNKAVYQKDIENEDKEVERHPRDLYPEIYFKPSTINGPPTEEHLLQNSLWPEIQKLYGHGYELFCIAVNHKYNLIASACKAAQSEHAAVIIWNMATWQQHCRLHAHKLTVTQLAFSPDDRYLLSVSRDRTWVLHEVGDSQDLPFVCVAKTDKETSVHTRIIWACAWTHDSKHFITVSRDKKLVIWGKSLKKEEDESSLNQYCVVHISKDFSDSITAINVAPIMINEEQYLIATGLDNGIIQLHSWDPCSASWSTIVNLSSNIRHDMTVKRLQFKPTYTEDTKSKKMLLHLASCGSDFSVRIFKLIISSVS